MDLTNLSPAPWEQQGCAVIAQCDGPAEDAVEPPDFFNIANTRSGARAPLANYGRANAEFIALARNAFDVMMRRGWFAERFGDAWIVHFPGADRQQRRGRVALDPFTALVEADKWYRENVEKEKVNE